MTDHTEMQIPDDVMEAARQAWNGIRNNSMRDGQFFIARAILAERERCARIAGACSRGSTARYRILNE